MKKEHYELVGSKTCKAVLAKYPNYKVFWRSGFVYRGASEGEDNKQPNIDIDHEKKEIYFNGFSENDMY